jgi:cobalt-zinc-cadmium efflux system protein
VSRTTRLAVVLMLNLTLVAGLVIVGVTAHSIGVLAEGADYAVDALAIGLSLLAIWLSHRPATPEHPLGYQKATKVAALINGGWLLVVSVLVVGGALDRLFTRTPRVNGLAVLVVSGIAAIVMLIGALILWGGGGEGGGGDGDDLNMRAVLLDTAADAAAAGGVAVAGVVIFATGRWYWLDPLVALVVAVVIGYQTVALLREAGGAVSAPPNPREI